eukprot:TRINITY_DN5538_c0_g1_i1.p1 TRINITY_DN5538_c0_g1~~TRINITY_DN5538_c0_g1_i1.p1  ORF type:complete len:577 (+),score=211.77 TRINITY_DN5538_c0_g1_i1:18-1748(+)
MEDNEDILDRLKDMGRKVLAPTKKKRRKALKRVAQWIVNSDINFNELHMDQIWKVLWYCMYMCDKLKNQQELAEEMGRIIHSLNESKAHLFFWRYYQTMAREWHGIDKWRTDKFYYLSHQILYNMFAYLKNNKWDLKMVEKFTNSLTEPGSILNFDFSRCPSVKLDLIQYYLQMFNSVIGEDKIEPPKEVIFKLFNPLFHLLLKERNINVRKRLNEFFFMKLHNRWVEHFNKQEEDQQNDLDNHNEPKSKNVLDSDEDDDDDDDESSDDIKPNKKGKKKEEVPEDGEEEVPEEYAILIDLYEFTLHLSRFCMDEDTSEGNRRYIFDLRNKFNVLLEKKTGSKLDLALVLPEKRKSRSSSSLEEEDSSKLETLSKHHYPQSKSKAIVNQDDNDEDDDDGIDLDEDDLPISPTQMRTNKLREILSSSSKKKRIVSNHDPKAEIPRKNFPSIPKTDPFTTPKKTNKNSTNNNHAIVEKKKSPNVTNNENNENNDTKKVIKSSLKSDRKKNKKSVTWSQSNEKVVFFPKCSPNAPPSSKSQQAHQEVKSPHSLFNKIMQKNLNYLSSLNLNQGRKRNKHN